MGLQQPGIAIIQALLKGGAIVTGAQLISPSDVKRLFKKFSPEKVNWVFDDKNDEKILQQDIIVSTIGAAGFEKHLDRARSLGVPVLTELDFVSQYIKGTLIGITGTNGKTTTAALLKKIFDEAKISNTIADGIRPFAKALGKPFKVVICEINTPRLINTASFHPHVAVITNLGQAHTERHRTLLDYYLTKAKIYANQTEADFLIFNKMSEAMELTFQKVPPKARLVPFHYIGEVPEGVFKRGSDIFYQGPQGLSRFSLNDFKLPGAHNIENLMAAVAAAKSLGVEDSAIAQAIPRMESLPTRLQSLGKVHGVTYVNDARATNPGATAWALHTLKKNVILIAGGQPMSGIHYEILNDYLTKHAKLLILFGLDRNKFFQTWGESTEAFLVETLKEAVILASRKAEEGDYILFSPGAPPELHSHGTTQLRGEEFNEIVEEIREQEKQRKLLQSELRKF